MLEPLEQLPGDVLGFRSRGELRMEDYTDVLLPALTNVLESGGEIRVVLVFQEWGGMSTGAFWEDLKLGLEHLTRWKKIALVTDVEWMINMTRLFGWMTPGDLKHFPLSDQDAAIAWAAAT